MIFMDFNMLNHFWIPGIATIWSFVNFFYPLLCINSREGTGNPLQYSCLENPMDGGAW